MERCRSVRNSLQKAGLIAFDDGTSSPCIIKNLWPKGAKFSLPNAVKVPVEFSLTIGEKKSRVRTIWNTRFHIGVEFITA